MIARKSPILYALLGLGAGVLVAFADAPAHAGDDGAAKEDHGPSGGKPDFHNLRAIVVPIIHDGEVSGSLTTELTLETAGKRNLRRIEENELRIRDLFTAELYGLVEAEANGLLELDHGTVKAYLKAAGERLLGTGVVDAVLVRTLVRTER